MATSHGGTVELGFPFLDPSSAFGGTSNLSSDLPSGVGTQRPPWLNGFSSSIGSARKVFPGLDPQDHFAKRDSTAACLPSFASPISSFSQISDFHVNPLLLPFHNQANALRMTRASTVPQNYGDNILFRDRVGQSSLPFTMNGASLLLSGKHGELINMAKLTPQEIMDAKALAASKSHSEAERRRRERINTHLATLRGLLPNTTKTDKASLLAEVIQHVKELKRQAAEIAEGGPVPSDVDELRVDIDSSYSKDQILIKASICCDDRPGLLSDIIRTLRNLKLQTVRAEIATLGGRVKFVIMLTSEDATSGTQDGPLVTSVQEALRAVMERSASNELSPAGFGSNKRQRMGSQDFNPF
ncbi:hypothetical protein O6H91_08G097400 [Diphasiastrum complanatum]|uniref:Uncharacterized protein n=1 Tax=Diphasiastrum complanatum TaxID=34168 RepID=A0ACC2D0A2_DIPCM|nr:hypothetical protein O6H91_Y474400 [Diphasiastrum complanatum]KAJ7547666.1 hypothetical protein O6H91_08G097400 [Diphasiastrum complanatum]